MYARCGDHWVALGDPYGPYVELEELIWKFQRLASSSGGSCAFFDVSGENLHFYMNTGLNFYRIGDEAKIALEYYPSGKKNDELLRAFSKKMDSDGYSFRVLPRNASPSFFKNAAALSREWLNYRKIKEPGFITGHFDVEYLRHFHIACVFDKSERLVCFANILTGPERGEYRLDILRSAKGVPDGMERYLKYKLVLWGKEKHFAFFNLGLAPVAGSEINTYSPPWKNAGAALYNYGAKFNNPWSLRKEKEVFSPQWHARYIVCDSFLSVPSIFSEISLLTLDNPIKK